MSPSYFLHSIIFSLLMNLCLIPNAVYSGSCNSLYYKKCEMRMDEHHKPDKLLCNGGLHDKDIHYNYNYYSVKPRIIVICQVQSSSFDPSFLTKFPNLYRLSLINSPNITKFSHPFPEHHHLHVLNLTRLGLTHLSYHALKGLTNLKQLDLSYNNLRHLDKHFKNFFEHQLQQIHLRGNDWECNSHMKWVQYEHVTKKILDKDEMTCGFTSKFPGKPFRAVMILLTTVKNECPKAEEKSCNCTLDNVVWSPDRTTLYPVITVNCSRLNLTSMPASLPNDTTTLLLIGNKISDISPLKSSSIFLNVSNIFLDENLVSNIDILEGAVWLTKFRVFSLRKNKISMFQTYVLDNGFGQNNEMAKVFFGNNPWICDCTFTPSLKELLVKYNDLIGDIKQIRCEFDKANDNYLKPISELHLSNICIQQNSFLSRIDCLILVLGFLNLFIFVKFIYDYWIFRTTGRLPWIVTMIP